MTSITINDLFEKRWAVYLKSTSKVSNDAWVKELARDFFGIGYAHGCKKEKLKSLLHNFEMQTSNLLISNSGCKCMRMTDKYRNIFEIKINELLEELDKQ